MIWNEKIETMGLNDLKNLQSERLKKMIEYIYSHSAFYKKRLCL